MLTEEEGTVRPKDVRKYMARLLADLDQPTAICGHPDARAAADEMLHAAADRAACTMLEHRRALLALADALCDADELTLTGHVASLAHGIQDSEQTGSSGQLATVSPTFQWVRLAQRLPVRVALDPLPAGVQLFAGQTVSVIIQQPAHAG